MGVVRGLFDWFAVLVVGSKVFPPVREVPNRNPIPVLQIGHGTLFAIGFPSNGRNEFAVLEVRFRLLLPVLVPKSIKHLENKRVLIKKRQCKEDVKS